jgi:putative ABC transport system permease protein
VQIVLQDLRYGWRGLKRRPWFASIVILTLALGIGVNTAVFSVFYAVLMRPLPYDRPERLVRIWANFQSRGAARAPFSGGILREIEQRNRAFTGVGGIWIVGPSTFTGESPEQVKTARITANFFDVLGVRAGRGRSFTREDAGGPATMLSDGFFRRRFGANDGLLGKTLPMQGTEISGVSQGAANSLVGVLPANFQLHFAPDANVPGDVDVFNTFDYGIYDGLTQYYLRLVARMKPGVSVRQAQLDLDRVSTEIRSAFGVFASEGLQLKLAGLQDDAFGDVRPALAAMFAGAALVLLICCVNVTALLLARASDRHKEIAMRLALGASRGRILRQLLAEAAMLSVLGGVAGLAVGWAVFRTLLAIRPERLARIADAGFQWPVMAFAAGVSVAATLVFGIAPALQSFRLDQIEALRNSWLGRMRRGAGRALILAEITLAFVLVAGAALTARTLAHIKQARPGFEPRQLLTFQLAVAGAFRSPGELSQWENELGALPGVERVGAATHLPLDTDLPNWYGPYRPQGAPDNESATRAADLRPVTPGFFPAMGVRLLEGRYFDQRDREGGLEVAIVDESLARSAWPGQSAIGKWIDAEHVTRNGFETLRCVVVGVVEHVHNHSLTAEVRGQIYMPYEQSRRSPVTFVLRAGAGTGVDPLSLVPAIRASLRRRAPNAAIAKVRPMTEYVDREIAPAGFTAVLAAMFGALALLLAATGIYGVFNDQVSRRLPEMGVRMAVGANARDVLTLVLREGLELAAIGVVIGGAAAYAAANGLGTLLYGVSPRDPWSYGLALLLLPAAALLGCWRPAWRAASANPAEIIRAE